MASTMTRCSPTGGSPADPRMNDEQCTNNSAYCIPTAYHSNPSPHKISREYGGTYAFCGPHGLRPRPQSRAHCFLRKQTEFGDGTVEEPINHEYRVRDLISRYIPFSDLSIPSSLPPPTLHPNPKNPPDTSLSLPSLRTKSKPPPNHVLSITASSHPLTSSTTATTVPSRTPQSPPPPPPQPTPSPSPSPPTPPPSSPTHNP